MYCFLITCLIHFYFDNGFHLHVFPSLFQNGCFGDADIDRLKLADSYLNGTQVQVNVETLQHVFLYSHT